MALRLAHLVSLWILVVLSCAAPTAKAVRPPEPERSRFDVPPATDEALASAFDAPKDTPKIDESSLVGTSSADSPKPQEKQLVMDAAWEAFEKAKDRADVSATKKALDECVKVADRVGLAAQQRVHAAAFQWALAQKQSADAKKYGKRWLHHCGPYEVDSCRAKALKALANFAATSWAKQPALTRHVQELEGAHNCVAQADRTTASDQLPTCLVRALSLFQKDGDLAMTARTHWVEAKRQLLDVKKETKSIQQLQKLIHRCPIRACDAVTVKAHRALVDLRLKRREHALAANHLAQFLKRTADATDDESLYLWNTEVMEKCSSIDAAVGRGTCRKKFFAELRKHSYFDFSQTKASSELLSLEEVNTVKTHFGFLIEQCLRAEASQMDSNSVSSFELDWMVVPEGKVARFQLNGKAPGNSPMGDCLRQQFVIWRYPRFSGENQHIHMKFSVGKKTAER